MSNYTGQYPSVYKIVDYGQKIGDMANKLAYPNNPKVAQYPSGHATEAFKTTFAKVFKGFKFWNAWSKVGASCDVFTATCVRAAYDKNIPAGLWKILRYMESHANYVKVKATVNTLQDGDIIIYKKNKVGRHGHICIYYKGKIKEASAKHYFGRTTDMVANRLSTAGKKYVYVFRVKNGETYNPIKKGSQGQEVIRLQNYLNWFWTKDIKSKKKKILKVDGDFGKLTDARVKAMQNALKVKQDGVVGKITLAKMKEASR